MDTTTSSDPRLILPGPEATEAFGRFLADRVRPGDTLLLSGDIGAGKSHLARSLIQTILPLWGAPPEDVPSPTYTLVQTYETLRGDILHADLYRLVLPEDVEELGLLAAFGSALTLVEWPDRLGPDLPVNALTIALAPAGPDGAHRMVTLSSAGHRWGALFDDLPAFSPAPLRQAYPPPSSSSPLRPE